MSRLDKLFDLSGPQFPLSKFGKLEYKTCKIHCFCNCEYSEMKNVLQLQRQGEDFSPPQIPTQKQLLSLPTYQTSFRKWKIQFLSYPVKLQSHTHQNCTFPATSLSSWHLRGYFRGYSTPAVCNLYLCSSIYN